MTTYYALRVGAMISRVVPVQILYLLAALAARVAYLLPTRARGAVRANIAQVLGQPATSPAVRRAAAQAFRCQALNYVDLMRIDHITRAEFDAMVASGDLSAFHDLAAAGKGVIILAAHLGNIDMIVQWLALRGFRVHAPMERLEPPRLYELVRRQRMGVGMQVHPVGPEAVGPLVDALRAGDVIALVGDRAVGGSGEFVEFFGAPARLPVGPALLALRTGAPVLLGIGRRLRDNRMFLTVGTPVYLRRTRNLRADLHEGMRVIARQLEIAITTAPEQWIVFEPVWPSDAAAAEGAA